MLNNNYIVIDWYSLLQAQPAGTSGASSGQPHRRKQEFTRKPAADGRTAALPTATPTATDTSERADKQGATASISGRGSTTFIRAEASR